MHYLIREALGWNAVVNPQKKEQSKAAQPKAKAQPKATTKKG